MLERRNKSSFERFKYPYTMPITIDKYTTHYYNKISILPFTIN